MSDVTLPETLRAVEFLRNMKDGHLDQLANIMRTVEYPAQSEVFKQGDVAKDVYLVATGRVSLINCQRSVGCRHLMEAGAGELIGWSPLVGRPQLSVTVRTLAPTKLLAVNGEQLLKLCRETPEFGFEFMCRAAQVLAERLSATRLQLLELGGIRLPEFQIESD